METVGLGDVVEKFTKATGIKKLADSIPGGCGCEQRKKTLNNSTSIQCYNNTVILPECVYSAIRNHV